MQLPDNSYGGYFRRQEYYQQRGYQPDGEHGGWVGLIVLVVIAVVWLFFNA